MRNTVVYAVFDSKKTTSVILGNIRLKLFGLKILKVCGNENSNQQHIRNERL